VDDQGDEPRSPDRRDQPPDDPDAGSFEEERVRIIGADEARAAMERGQPIARPGGDNGDARFAEMRFNPSSRLRSASYAAEDVSGDPTGATGGGADPDADPHADDPDAGSWSTRDLEPPVAPPRIVGADERVAQSQLPHWTDPPTGQLPRIFADDPEPDADAEAEAWSQVPPPRYRENSGDWADPDFHPDELRKDDQPLGALADEPEAFDDDDDDAFLRQVQERRGRGRVAPRLPVPDEAEAAAAAAVADPDPRADERHDVDAGFGGPLRPPMEPGTGTGRRADRDYDFGPPEFRPQPSRPDDLVPRVIAAVVLAAIALLCFSLGRGWTVALVTVIAGLSCSELYAGARPQGYRPAALLGILGAASFAPIAYERGTDAFPLVIAIVLVFTLLWFLLGVARARPVANLGLTWLGFSYVGFLAGFAGLLLSHPDGVRLMVGVVLCVVANDIVAFGVGRRFGRTPLAPHISPGKTWAGAIAGFVASVLVAAIIVHQFRPWDESIANSLWLGIVLGVAAPVGDLVESMLKRDLGLKDFGGLLPGHGGFLDRFDALLFAMPFAYYLVRVLNI
jgi:phosphatidate cytidylyltransferase